jgi:putative endonuclease
MDRSGKGRAAEDRAAAYLRGLGFRIVARNWRSTRGEIDLIAERDGLLCFVEVRERGRGARVGPLESVDARKRARITAAAQAFLARNALTRAPVRFDVIAIDSSDRLTHIASAF